MKKNKFQIFILTLSLALGSLVTLQLKSEVPEATNFVGDEIEARDILLKQLSDEQAYLQSRIVNLRGEIQERQEKIALSSAESNVERLNELKRKIGLTEIEGEGIEIILDDSSQIEREGIDINVNFLVQASDIRDVINILFASNAAGVAINNQRIINSSAITSVDGSILVNNSHISPPFVITAVANPILVTQRMQENDIIEIFEKRMEKGQIRFSLEEKASILIPIYNGNLKTEHLNLISS